MNKAILLPAAIVGVLVGAMVLAAPQGAQASKGSVTTLDRAEAYRLAQAD